MSQSETLAALAVALASFQSSVHGAAKNANNTHLGNKYANLEAIWEAIREPLTDNGLSVVQLPAPGANGHLNLRTRLMHASGEWVESEIAIPLGKQDPQGYGSALTYARRYGLAAMLGIVQEDDDGEGAMQRGQSNARKNPPPVETSRPAAAGQVTEAQLKRLFAIAKGHGLTAEEVRHVMKRLSYGIGDDGEAHTNLLTRTQYDTLCSTVLEQAGAAKARAEEEVPA